VFLYFTLSGIQHLSFLTKTHTETGFIDPKYSYQARLFLKKPGFFILLDRGLPDETL